MRLILFFIYFFSSNLAYSICYYQINNKTIYNERIVNEIVSVSLSKYVEQVNPLPLSGTKSGACVYSISITPDFVTTVNGRKINDSGESELNDLKAVRQSLLRAIYKGIPNQRKILCRDYGDSALYYYCNPSKKKKSSFKFDDQTSNSIPNTKTTPSRPLIINGGETAFNATNLNIGQYYLVKGKGKCHYEFFKFITTDKNVYTFISSSTNSTSIKLTKDIGGKMSYCPSYGNDCRLEIRNYSGEMYVEMHLCSQHKKTNFVIKTSRDSKNEQTSSAKKTKQKNDCVWNNLRAGMSTTEVRQLFGRNEKGQVSCMENQFLLYNNAWIWFISGFTKGAIIVDNWQGRCYPYGLGGYIKFNGNICAD